MQYITDIKNHPDALKNWIATVTDLKFDHSFDLNSLNEATDE